MKDDRVRLLIKGKLKELGLDMAEVSRAIGKSHSYLQQFFSRGVPIELKEREREKLAPILGVSPDDLRLTPREIADSSPLIPTDGERRPRADPPSETSGEMRIREYDVGASAGPGLQPPEINGGDGLPVLAEWTMPADMIRAHTAPDARLAVIRVEGDSMEPDYLSGDRVLIDLSRRAPSPPGVFVVWDGIGLVLKRVELVIGSDPRRISLSSINSAYRTYEAPLEGVHIAGRVIGKWMWR